jgi:hypothetical protein
MPYGKMMRETLWLWAASGLSVVHLGCATPPPQAVIAQALEAARDGDREALLECFTPRSRPLLETWWRAVDAENPALGRLGAGEAATAIERLVPGRDGEPDRAVLNLREGGDSMRIVTHRLAGMWRIDLLDTERVLLVNQPQ